MCLCLFCCVFDLYRFCFWAAICNVVIGGSLEHGGFLADNTDSAAQAVLFDMRNVLSRNTNFTLFRVIQPQYQIDKSRFSSARCPDNANFFAGLHRQGYIANAPVFIAILETYVVEFDRWFGHAKVGRVRGVDQIMCGG